MFDRLLANASPLIFLSRVEGLVWLANLSVRSVEVPQAVLQEIEAGADGREVRGRLALDPRFKAVPALRLCLWSLPGTWARVKPRAYTTAYNPPAGPQSSTTASPASARGASA